MIYTIDYIGETIDSFSNRKIHHPNHARKCGMIFIPIERTTGIVFKWAPFRLRPPSSPPPPTPPFRSLVNETIQLRTNANSIFDVFTYLSFSTKTHVVHPKNAIHRVVIIALTRKWRRQRRQRRQRQRRRRYWKGRENVRKSHRNDTVKEENQIERGGRQNETDRQTNRQREKEIERDRVRERENERRSRKMKTTQP